VNITSTGAIIQGDSEHKLGMLENRLLRSEGGRCSNAGNQAAGCWPRTLCLHELFERQMAARPQAIAATCGGQELSYGELNERANQLAHYLQRHGVGPDVLVGIYLERTLDLLVGILGILKAGGAYVLLDLAYPKDRTNYMLEDSGAPVVITQRGLVRELAGSRAKLVFLDADWSEISREPTENPYSGVQADHLAYVIYTSGSTGKPKGALISHYNVVRLFQATQAWFQFAQRDVWTLFHSYAFDFSVWELWGALLYGGRLVVVPFSVSRTPEEFYRLLGKEGVTVLNQTPSAFRQLIGAEEVAGVSSSLALRVVIFGGEALDLKTLKPWFDRHGDQTPQLVNMYGITETTVHVTYRPISRADLSSGSMIGVPIPDVQVHLLDEQQRSVPVGVPGEICVGGAGVGRGYLNRPDLTAQKFIPDPFRSEPGARLYRSGDLGRALPNGDLEYLGRIDHQVKIRGFRIELGEIESVLNQHPGVRESVVIPREDLPGERSLVAYLITRTGADICLPALRELVRARLPEYMMPAAFVFIDRLPLTVNGKLDTAALPAPDKSTAERPIAFVAPETELQRAIASIWQDVLNLPAAGLDDNFFDLGGNSIRLAQVHGRLQGLLGRQFPITDLFAYTNIRALAAHFGSLAQTASSTSTIQDRARHQREALSVRRNLRCPPIQRTK
jgi:amino acid adenylation domain-containing protein